MPRSFYADGPLRRRPPEEIRYDAGKCALGHLVVALSEEGVVSIVIRSAAAKLLPELKSRFPKASLVRDARACRAVIGKVRRYVARPAGCLDLPLDLRGTEFQKRVWREVRKIPAGRTSTYSRIAEAIGAPKAVRAVGSSCTRCGLAFAIPCHRVLSKGGAGRDAQGSRRYRWLTYEAQLVARLKRGGRRARSGFDAGQPRAPAGR